MEALLNKQIVFFGGKGGVGKSTSSSAFALAAAKQGQQVLLVSTDPAHNLGDIFGETIGDQPKKVIERLSVIEIDADHESKRYIGQVKDNLKGLVKATMVDEVYRQIDLASHAPGADEAALFDRIVSIILDEAEQFDMIVFDTAPTGHTIRLLTLPELMGVWMDGMLKRREKVTNDFSQWMGDGEKQDDPIYDILNDRKQRFADVRKILLDQEKTGFVFVLNPERLPIVETEKAINQLHSHDLLVNHLIVNKVLPENIEGAFYTKRKAREADYLQDISERFSSLNKVFVPLMETDVTEIRDLEKLSSHFTT